MTKTPAALISILAAILLSACASASKNQTLVEAVPETEYFYTKDDVIRRDIKAGKETLIYRLYQSEPSEKAEDGSYKRILIAVCNSDGLYTTNTRYPYRVRFFIDNYYANGEKKADYSSRVCYVKNKTQAEIVFKEIKEHARFDLRFNMNEIYGYDYDVNILMSNSPFNLSVNNTPGEIYTEDEAIASMISTKDGYKTYVFEDKVLCPIYGKTDGSGVDGYASVFSRSDDIYKYAVMYSMRNYDSKGSVKSKVRRFCKVKTKPQAKKVLQEIIANYSLSLTDDSFELTYGKDYDIKKFMKSEFDVAKKDKILAGKTFVIKSILFNGVDVKDILKAFDGIEINAELSFDKAGNYSSFFLIKEKGKSEPSARTNSGKYVLTDGKFSFYYGDHWVGTASMTYDNAEDCLTSWPMKFGSREFTIVLQPQEKVAEIAKEKIEADKIDYGSVKSDIFTGCKYKAAKLWVNGSDITKLIPILYKEEKIKGEIDFQKANDMHIYFDFAGADVSGDVAYKIDYEKNEFVLDSSKDDERVKIYYSDRGNVIKLDVNKNSYLMTVVFEKE